MKNIFRTAALSLLIVSLCSCGGGGDTGTLDCSSSTNVVTTSSGKVVASATATVIPSGASSYSILGTNMDNVAGIQLDITYDKGSLANPTITQGALVAGALLAANTSRPGLIKIAIISTHAFSGSGEIAVISFASKTGNGGITSISTSMIDSKGVPIETSSTACR
jgi:hypothetical protein